MTRTAREYTTQYRDHGSVTVPAGTRTTHNTACGIDENYNFVDNFTWVKPYPDGTLRHGLIHDLTYYGLNVPPDYLEHRT